MAATVPGSNSPSTGSSSAVADRAEGRVEPPAEVTSRGGLRRLLRRSRRRLRANRALRALSRVAPYAAAFALCLAGLGRLVDLAWADPVAIAGALVVLVAAPALAVLRRVSLMDAALAADRGLRTGEVLSTSLELGDRSDVLANRVRHQARVAAGTGSARRAVPLRADPRRLGAALLIATVAGWAIVASNPQDARRAERTETRRVLDLAATRVRVAAEELGDDEPIEDEAAREAQLAADAATAARLEELARQLERLDNFEDAEALLQRAEADLGASLTAETEARKAAAIGLDRSVAMLPLLGFANPNDPETAATQLDDASRRVVGLRDDELDALARRLGVLAETQRLGDPELEAAFDRASQALRARDREAAGAALAEAADLQRAALAQVEAAERRAEVAGEVGAAANDVNRARRAREASRAAAAGGAGQQGTGSDERGSGGNGAGAGGQPGNQGGQGRGGQGGQGSGQNATGAGGRQQGAASGNGAVAGARGGTGSGLSDPGTAAAGGGSGEETFFPEVPIEDVDEFVNAGTDAVMSPGGTAQPGAGGGGGEMVEVTDVPTADGGAAVPLSEALPSYEAQATTALERPDIPAEDRVLVRRYFDELNQE